MRVMMFAFRRGEERGEEVIIDVCGIGVLEGAACVWWWLRRGRIGSLVFWPVFCV
jgi:hypothetical protein